MLLLCGLRQEIQAEEYMVYEDFVYTYDEKDGGIRLTHYSGNAKIVSVPSNIKGIPVRYMGEVFYKNSTIEKVELPEGLVNISGFEQCTNLKEVNIPKSVISIDSYAFKDCRKLANVNLPKEIKEIGDFAFFNCRSLKQIHVPDSVTLIEQGAFGKCIKLEKVKLSKSLSFIDWETFKGCKKLKSINIPNGIKVIEDEAFSGCKSLEKVVFPISLVSIRDEAFEHCGFKKITIPKNVTYIGSNAFYHCRKLVKVTIKSSTIKKMGTLPFFWIDEKVVFDVPNKCIRKYGKMIGWVGEKGTMKIK